MYRPALRNVRARSREPMDVTETTDPAVTVQLTPFVPVCCRRHLAFSYVSSFYITVSSWRSPVHPLATLRKDNKYHRSHVFRNSHHISWFVLCRSICLSESLEKHWRILKNLKCPWWWNEKARNNLKLDLTKLFMSVSGGEFVFLIQDIYFILQK